MNQVSASVIARGQVLPARAEASAFPEKGEPEHRGPLHVVDDFAVLDDPLEQQTFTSVAEHNGKTACDSVLMVQGMYCAACADTVESALQGVAGVLSAQVHAATRRLSLRWDPALTRMSDLARAVGATGYRLLPMQQALSLNTRLAETRKALWRLFVAGFCMMQVMMYAWPAYVAAPGEITPDIEQLLRWASWMLSLPVVFFASGPFFDAAWRDLKRGRVGMDTPVSIGILVTFVVSTAATFDPTGPWGGEVWFDSLTMFVFFLLGGRYLEFKARDRTAGALDALMNRLPERCERQTPEGGFQAVSLKRLVVGDVVRVHAGQAFPGDGVLLSASATVDEALLTGESRPVTHRLHANLVAGSYNLAGPVLMRLEQLGANTRFAQIVKLMEQASIEKPRLAVLADRVAAPFLVLVLIAAALASAYWGLQDQHKALAVGVAVLIVTCPCALSLATPAAMLSAAGALARRGVLVRRLQAFEALAEVDAVVFDKTGTLTHDRMTLRRFLVRPGSDESKVLPLAAALAAQSLHPVSQAIARALGQAEKSVQTPGEVKETPGQGLQWVAADGGVWRLGNARWCGLARGALAPEALLQDAPGAYLSDAQGWLATFWLDEGIRSDAAQTMASLKALGLEVRLLSGDQQAAAQRVAQAVCIESIEAQATPERKLRVVTEWQQAGQRLAMVGDGLNDGPVLAKAHVSFALGHGAPLAQAQSDFVVQSGELTDVVFAVRLARQTLRVVRQNLLWAALYNAVSIPLALVGWMPPWLAGLGMACSSLLVILNALRLTRSPPETPYPTHVAAPTAA
jgi:P-type Cu2+ transporter